MKIRSFALNIFLLFRFFTAFLIFSVSILAAKVFGSKAYGDLSFFIFWGKFLLIFNFGATSGFMQNYYLKKSKGAQLNKIFTLYYCLHLLFVFLVAASVFIFLGQTSYLSGAVVFLCLVPLYTIEPTNRIKKKFFISLLPDLALYTAMLITIGLYKFDFININAVYPCILGLTLIKSISFFFLFKNIKRKNLFFLNQRKKKSFYTYLNLLKKGFPLYFGSTLFLLFSNIDRLFIEKQYPALLGTYSLALQLSAAAGLIISSVTFTSMVDIGEKMHQKNELLHNCILKIKSGSLILFLSTSGITTLAFFLEKYVLLEFNNLTIYTFVLSLAYSSFHLSGLVTPVAFYLSRLKKLNYGLFIILGIACTNGLLFMIMSKNIMYMIGISSLTLFIYSIYSIIHVTSLLKQLDEKTISE